MKEIGKGVEEEVRVREGESNGNAMKVKLKPLRQCSNLNKTHCAGVFSVHLYILCGIFCSRRARIVVFN